MAIKNEKTTEIVKKRKGGGAVCPYCPSKYVNSELWDHQGLHIVIEMNCDSCNAQWFEIFNFMHVEEPTED